MSWTDDLERPAAGGEAPPSAAERYIGTVVGSTYRITRHIGSGGSSHVFEAEHVRLSKPFAVKLLRPELHKGRKAAQRFRREAKAIARLRSEHVVSVIDCGAFDDGVPYLVMELLPGEDLRSLLRREHTLPAQRAVRIVIEACRGLAQVHAAGLVHRDLKPENLFITTRATGEDWCKVLDFGVVKMEATQSTAQGRIVGTVRYMAPEQLASVSTVGPTTDVYALGAILHECLCGAPLHDGVSVQEVMYRVMNVQPAALSALRPDLPRALTSVVERATAKQQDQRPQSAEKLARLLSEALLPRPESVAGFDTPLEDYEPLPQPPRTPRPVVPWTVAPIILAAVGVAVGIGVAVWSGARSPGSPGPNFGLSSIRSTSA